MGRREVGGGRMTWVMFDYGCVICTPQPERELAAMAAVAGATLPEFVEAYWAPRIAYDRAEVGADEYWRAVAGRLGRVWDGAATAELMDLDTASWMHLRPGTVRLIEDLAARGARIAMLSNAPQVLAAAIAALPLAGCFEHLLFSCDLRVAKPDPRCFGMALTRLAAEPADVIFIDDRAENVAAAARLGLRALRFTGAGALRAELAAQLA
jgi:putative hydrolase of the HAD superfamily